MKERRLVRKNVGMCIVHAGLIIFWMEKSRSTSDVDMAACPQGRKGYCDKSRLIHVFVTPPKK